MSVFCRSFNELFHSCDPSVEYLLWGSILAVIDVEAEGAGDGEGQVGDNGNRVHPGGPWDGLQIFNHIIVLVNLKWILAQVISNLCMF